MDSGGIDHKITRTIRLLVRYRSTMNLYCLIRKNDLELCRDKMMQNHTKIPSALVLLFTLFRLVKQIRQVCRHCFRCVGIKN